MEWYYVCWPWLTSKRVARVCQHQLSFLFYWLGPSPIDSGWEGAPWHSRNACLDLPLQTLTTETSRYWRLRFEQHFFPQSYQDNGSDVNKDWICKDKDKDKDKDQAYKDQDKDKD